MKQFKELGVTAPSNGFEGDKIKISRVQNRQIIVHNFKIEPSKFLDKGNGKCLTMQIEMDGTKYVLFTGSIVLMDMIQKVPKVEFPFMTTIIMENDRFQFQ